MPFYLIRLDSDGTIAPASISHAVLRKCSRLSPMGHDSDAASSTAHIATLIKHCRPLVMDCLRTFCTRDLYNGLKRHWHSGWRRKAERSVLAILLSTKSFRPQPSLGECESMVRSCLHRGSSSASKDKQLWLYVNTEGCFYIKTHTIGVDEDAVRRCLSAGCADPQTVGYGIFEGRIYDEIERIQRSSPSLQVVRCVDYGLVSRDAVKSLKPNGWDELSGDGMARFCDVIRVMPDRTITYIITRREERKAPYEDVMPGMTGEMKASVLAKLCAMFATLHAHACYHCDLHARNFLCDLSGNVTLFDFDLACCHSANLDSEVWYEFEYDRKRIDQYAAKYGIDVTDGMLSRCYDMFSIFVSSELAKSPKWAMIGRRYLGIDDLEERVALAKMRTRRMKRGTSPFTRAAIQSLLIFSDCDWNVA